MRLPSNLPPVVIKRTSHVHLTRVLLWCFLLFFWYAISASITYFNFEPTDLHLKQSHLLSWLEFSPSTLHSHLHTEHVVRGHGLPYCPLSVCAVMFSVLTKYQLQCIPPYSSSIKQTRIAYYACLAKEEKCSSIYI